MPAAPHSFAQVALVGNDRDARVVETMQILAVHLHARGRKVFAESDSAVDFGTTRIERRSTDKLAADANLVVAIGDRMVARIDRLEPLTVDVVARAPGR